MKERSFGTAHLTDIALVLETDDVVPYDVASFIPDPRLFIKGKTKIEAVYELIYEEKIMPTLLYIKVGDVKLIKI
jgi:hypothetical protein